MFMNKTEKWIESLLFVMHDVSGLADKSLPTFQPSLKYLNTVLIDCDGQHGDGMS